jgi:putative nucleotidyltransferase with HDIG domain
MEGFIYCTVDSGAVDAMDQGDLARILPEMELVSDPDLRDRVAKVWSMALERSTFKSLEGIPFTLLIEGLKDTLLEHTGRVTRSADAVVRTRTDLRRDIVLAGALLHDVGKVLEYTAPEGDGPVGKSQMGKLLRHPVTGAALAIEAGLPADVVHVIAAHAGEGDLVTRTPEAIVVYHCDLIDFEITKAKLGRGGSPPKVHK